MEAAASARYCGAMSEENLHVVKRAYAAMERGDIPAVLELCAPEIEFDNSNAAFDATVFRGRDGVLDFFARSGDMWESQRFEGEEFIPIGEDQVLVHQRIVSVGRDGVETVARSASLVTLREGKAVHVKAFQTKAEALEAAGLRE
jgi:ketosteroid isomerase-like protein